jgi:hypothetical protein
MRDLPAVAAAADRLLVVAFRPTLRQSERLVDPELGWVVACVDRDGWTAKEISAGLALRHIALDLG